jgi:exodeoxyribonuclease VII small subunit
VSTRKGGAAGEPADSPGYAGALEELEEILEELEGDQLDVDVLAERVRRASELIKACRGRIARAQADVDAIVAELEDFDAAEAEGAADDEDDNLD